jgi:hypothetical protein
VARGARRGAAAAACAAGLLAAAGCSGGNEASVPDGFCEVPVARSALAPLVPEHGKVAQTYAGGKAEGYGACHLTSAGKAVLVVNFYTPGNAPDPDGWKKPGDTAERPVSFLGHADITGDSAVVRADCVSPDKYMTFVISASGERVDRSPTGYRKLQRFVDDFVPKVTEKFGCTL